MRRRGAKPTIALSLGDPYGIGPEVVAAALAEPRVRRACHPVLFGDAGVLARAAKVARVRLPATEVVGVTDLTRRRFRFGQPGPEAGRAAVAYLEAAVRALRAGEAHGLCTAPIHKKRVSAAGFRFPGHTEYLQRRFAAQRVVMMLVAPGLRVALATVHVPLMRVARELRRLDLLTTLTVVEQALRADFGLWRPRLAVTGLNPHAGEEGLLGREEAALIAPAIRAMRRRGSRVEGPFPADSLFGRQLQTGAFDAIVAMYHDQGLGPLKAVAFDRGVNVTLGLPLPRTSPDHGTADDIAGQGVADPRSMIEAVLLAAALARQRERQ